MPASVRETETEEGVRQRQQRDQGNHSSHNIVSVISQFADDNLTLVRVGVFFVCVLQLAGDAWALKEPAYADFIATVVGIHFQSDMRELPVKMGQRR